MLGAIFGGITSLGGLLGANAAARRAEQERQQALSQAALDNDQLYQGTLNANTHTLQQAAGVGGDAIASLGRNLGSNLANAGVYNSSATAGALAGAQRGTDAALAQQASQLQLGALQQKQQGLLNIDQQKIGYANQDLGYARDNVSQARGGVGSFLGSLATSNLFKTPSSTAQTYSAPTQDQSAALSQGLGPLNTGQAQGATSALDTGGGLSSFLGSNVQNNLFNTGANTYRAGLPALPGTVGQGANLPGNAGYSPMQLGNALRGFNLPGF